MNIVATHTVNVVTVGATMLGVVIIIVAICGHIGVKIGAVAIDATRAIDAVIGVHC